MTDVDERHTARLTLRRITAADEGAIVALHTDPLNYPYSSTGTPDAERAREMTRMFTGHWERDGIGYWLAEHEGTLVGIIGITPSPLGGRQCWNLYFRFTPSARGRGLAREAARESVAVGRELAPGRPVVVRTRADNAAAIGLALSMGLERRADLDAGGFIVFLSPARSRATPTRARAPRRLDGA